MTTAMNLMSSVKLNNQMSSVKISHFKALQCPSERCGLLKQIDVRKLPTIYSKAKSHSLSWVERTFIDFAFLCRQKRAHKLTS